MNTLNTNGNIRTQASVLLYMLNFQKGRKFEVESNGKDIIVESAENGLATLKDGNHKDHALKVTNSDETLYLVEPFFVESFPDNDNKLKFHCKDIKTAIN